MKIIFFFANLQHLKKLLKRISRLPIEKYWPIKMYAMYLMCSNTPISTILKKSNLLFLSFHEVIKRWKWKVFWCLKPFPRKNFVRVLFLNRVKIVLRTNEYICAKNIFYNLCHKTRRQKKDGITCIFQLPLVICT